MLPRSRHRAEGGTRADSAARSALDGASKAQAGGEKASVAMMQPAFKSWRVRFMGSCLEWSMRGYCDAASAPPVVLRGPCRLVGRELGLFSLLDFGARWSGCHAGLPGRNHLSITHRCNQRGGRIHTSLRLPLLLNERA